MASFNKSYGESSITHNPFDKPTKFDTLAKFFQHSKGVRKLVRSNGNRIDISSLHGKIVGLFFMSVPTVVNKQTMRICILKVASAYKELSKSKKGRFEIVWIAKVDNRSQFHEYLEMMSWLAIPFADSEARNSLCNLTRIPQGYELFLFNREGKLFSQCATTLFSIYGADLYPFTDARIKEIRDEDYAIRGRKSLKNLLGNATRDFVLRNDGSQVSISELENKIVGIYFCDVHYPMGSFFAPKLLEIYRQLKRERKPFEVVMVNIGGCCREKHHNPNIKPIPWLSLPCVDSNCRRLVRIFDPYEIHNCLVIVGQRGSFVNMFGFSIVNDFGIEAYPFSRLSVTEMEKTKLEVSVKSLLTCGKKNYMIWKSGEKMPISYLSGKTILVLFAPFCGRNNDLVPNLIKWYAEIKKKHLDFEVILVASRFDDQSSFDEYYENMP